MCGDCYQAQQMDDEIACLVAGHVTRYLPNAELACIVSGVHD